MTRSSSGSSSPTAPSGAGPVSAPGAGPLAHRAGAAALAVRLAARFERAIAEEHASYAGTSVDWSQGVFVALTWVWLEQLRDADPTDYAAVQARAGVAYDLYAIATSRAPDLAAEALGYAITLRTDMTLLYPDGRSETLQIRDAVPAVEQIEEILGRPPFVDTVKLADGRRLHFTPRAGEINQEATKLVRAVKPQSVAIRGVAVVT